MRVIIDERASARFVAGLQRQLTAKETSAANYSRFWTSSTVNCRRAF